MTRQPTQPLFDRNGGREAIDAAVNAFHERVAQDDRVSHYFREADMETLVRHQKSFFTAGTGGPGEYTGREIAAVHAPLDISAPEFDIFTDLFEETLVSFEVPDRERRELLDIVEGYRSAVVTR